MKRILITTLIALLGQSVWAIPAAWYRWQSPESDVIVCSQTSPGDGWVATKGPFQDAACKKLGDPQPFR